MKFFITAEQYEALSDEMKAEYQKDGERYRVKLDVELFTVEQVDEKVSGLTSKRDELLNEVKTLKQKVKDAESNGNKDDSENKRLLDEAMQKISTLEADIEKGKTQGALSKIQGELKDELAKITKGKQLNQLYQLVKHRVGVHEGRGTVLNTDGKPTISSVKELVRQIQDSGDYDNLIEGSQANGGGENNDKGKPGEKWSDFNPQELSEIRKTDSTRYEKLKKTKGAK